MAAGTITAAPDRSLTQRMEALQRANDVRSRRAEVKRDVRTKRDPRPLLDQLRDPHEDFETMKVFDVLMVLPKVGRVKANKILQRCRVSPSKTIGGLSYRQRFELLACLGERM